MSMCYKVIFVHISVLKNEAIKLLDIKSSGTYLDLTGGRGGHSLAILEKLNDKGNLIVLDYDEFAYNNLLNIFSGKKNVKVFNDNFKNFDKVLNDLKITKVDGILFDLGMSSDQIDNPSRGFSYLSNNTLDMRMSQSFEKTAREYLNMASKEELANTFYKYGEYKMGNRLADLIIKNRPIKNSMQLVSLCDILKPRNKKGHSAKQVFQALRIKINDEVNNLNEMLEKLDHYLNIGGTVIAITFHSIEDRIVKTYFNKLAKEKIDKRSPIVIENEKNYELIVKKIKPTEKEMKENPRSKSAILRGVKKLR